MCQAVPMIPDEHPYCVTGIPGGNCHALIEHKVQFPALKMSVVL